MKNLTVSIVMLLFFMCVIPAFMPVIKASPTTRYVATTGSDTTGDGTIGNPYKTLQKALNVSSNSDIIYLRGSPTCSGNYNNMYPKDHGYNINRNGVAGAYFTIAGYPGEKVILNGAGYSVTGDYGYFHVGDNSHSYSYIHITNLKFENISGSADYGGDAIHLYGGDNHIIIDNVTINNIEFRGFNAWASDHRTVFVNNITLDHVTFNNTQTSLSTGETCTFYGGKDCVVRNCIFTNNTKIELAIATNSSNIDIYGNSFYTRYPLSTENGGIKIDGGEDPPHHCYARNISVHNNYFHLQFVGVSIQSEQEGSCENISIYNNIFDNFNPSTGMQSLNFNDAPDKSYQYYSNITVMYNTFNCRYSRGWCIDFIVHHEFWHNVVIANNIFEMNSTDSSAYIYFSSYANSTDSCFKFYNNLYNNTRKPPRSAWKTGVNTTFESTAIKQSPLFVNRNSGDFRLNASSPAIDHATASYIVSNDYWYNPRPSPVGGAYDIGAYEYTEQGSGDSTPPVISQIGITVSNPLDALAGYGWEYFSCKVTDNVAVSTVVLNVTNPDLTKTNYPMTKQGSTTTYYTNLSLHAYGNYSYVIQASDTSNNIALSSTFIFSLAPNWDVNRDGSVTVTDFVWISNHYSDTGPLGWMREDVDNNGKIEVLDMVLVSVHFGESWW
jgi:hypothetical protein